MFNRTGLLTKETTYLLKHLNKEDNWERAKQELHLSGYISSENRNNEIFREIKKRFSTDFENLPHLNSIKSVAKSNINPISKAEIYFVYLYCSNENVQQIVNQIFDIFDNNRTNLLLERKTILQLTRIHIKKKKEVVNEKTIQNWIGKLISTLKETRILLPKTRSTYIMNIGGITTETWIYFLMDAFFSQYGFDNALFTQAFHIKPEIILSLIDRSNNFNWILFSIQEFSTSAINFEYKPKYSSILEWLTEFDNE